MRLISFDVGIKNMAYCIFSLDDVERKSIKIIGWDVLNFTEYNLEEKQMNVQPSCLCQTSIEKKVKKVKTYHDCGKNAKYCYNGVHFCELHAKKHASTQGLYIPKKEYTMAYLKKQKMDKLYEIAKRDFYMELYASPSLAFATEKMKKQDLLDKLESLYSKRMMQFVEKKEIMKAGSMDLIYVGRVMKQMLDSIEAIETLTHVIVENQISPIASRMKTIQGMLAQYFIMREQSGKGGKKHIIEFISSANKLKGFKRGCSGSGDGGVVQENTNTLESNEKIRNPIQNKIVNKNYKANKKDGIEICNLFLEKNPEFSIWKTFFNEKPSKKDDLADCFLQGIYYMKLKNIIKNADDLKINLV